MREETEAAIENTKGMLKDMVIVVSLVHTLTESFGSAKDLFLKLKRSSKKEDSSDGEDGDRKHRHRLSRRHGDSSSDSDSGKGRRHHLKWRRRPEENPFTDSDEELVITSSSRVRAEYDRGYNRLGEPFARGDLMTQIQLQSQIIELQKTLLQIHQDYMMSTYLSPSSSHSHLIRLIQTTRAARAASIYALHLQYERLLVDAQPDPVPKLPGSFPSPPARKPRSDSVTQRPHSRPGHRSNSSSPAKCGDKKEYHIQPYPITTPAKCDEDQEYHIQPYPVPPPAPAPQPSPQKLFCVFARDLQEHDRLPLTDNYKVSGDNMCPFCHAHIAIQPGKAWEVVSDNCHARTGRKRIFMVRSRFVIKSHREGHGFACILCAKYRRSDTVCKEIGALMEHLWKDHGANEMENDEDIVEIED